MMKCEVVDNINISDVKTGQFIQIDKKKYVVVLYRGNYKLIPIALNEVINNIDSMIITDVFNAKNGDCIKHKIEKEVKEDV